MKDIENASDIDIRREQKGYLPISKLSIRERRCPRTQRVAPGPSPTTYIVRYHWHQVSHPGPSNNCMNPEERQVSK